jgi:hypothetical protein
MKYLEKDPVSGKEYENDLTTLPYVSIPKDTLIMASELLTPEQFGNVMYDLVNEMFCNCEYETARNKTNRTENVIFDRMVDNIGRLSSGYFKKCRNLKNNNQKKDKE